MLWCDYARNRFKNTTQISECMEPSRTSRVDISPTVSGARCRFGTRLVAFFAPARQAVVLTVKVAGTSPVYCQELDKSTPTSLAPDISAMACRRRSRLGRGFRLWVRSDRSRRVRLGPQCLQERIFSVRISGAGGEADVVHDASKRRL